MSAFFNVSGSITALITLTALAWGIRAIRKAAVNSRQRRQQRRDDDGAGPPDGAQLPRHLGYLSPAAIRMLVRWRRWTPVPLGRRTIAYPVSTCCARCTAKCIAALRLRARARQVETGALQYTLLELHDHLEASEHILPEELQDKALRAAGA